MLWHILERLQTVRRSPALIVATSDSPADKAILEQAQAHGCQTFAGSELDVLDRYYQAARTFALQHVVRCTADNPLVDPAEINRLIDVHLSSRADYTHALPELGSGFPKGVGAEIFTFACLERSWREGRAGHHREHVNEYVQENPASFRLRLVRAPENKRAPELNLSVDTPAEHEFLERVYRQLYRDGELVDVAEVVRLHRAGELGQSGQAEH